MNLPNISSKAIRAMSIDDTKFFLKTSTATDRLASSVFVRLKDRKYQLETILIVDPKTAFTIKSLAITRIL